LRNVIVSIFLSIDGFFEGLNKELDWHGWDNEMEKYMSDFLDTVDAIILGRVSYQLLAAYWPSSNESLAPKLNSLPKFVFSNTLEKVEWNNSRLIKGNIKDEISKIKLQNGKDLVLFGGADIASTFLQLDLIDEYQIIFSPVILGKGNPFFKDIMNRYNLKLLKTKSFDCGNVIINYQPIAK
jgi:dihydrofolate reductase